MELTSLDRLNKLEERVFDSVREYKTLLKTLDIEFKKNSSKNIDYLMRMEGELSKSLSMRVKTYNSHRYYLFKNCIIDNCHSDKMDGELKELKKIIQNFRNNLTNQREILKKEISSVSLSNRRFRVKRDVTAQRIEIVT